MKRAALLIAFTLLSGTLVSGCGLRGPLERPAPMWGNPPPASDDEDQKRREREQRQQLPSTPQTPTGVQPPQINPPAATPAPQPQPQ
ncbi:MAG TPA: lipoprotein [Caulobacterales bacterium]|nr:lipoprotein [Caulobacterales bacterium]